MGAARGCGHRAALARACAELEQAKREGNLARAGELQYGRIPELEKRAAEAEGASAGAMLREQVTEDDIASVVSRGVDRVITGGCVTRPAGVSPQPPLPSRTVSVGPFTAITSRSISCRSPEALALGEPPVMIRTSNGPSTRTRS
mgnify:CR=1 FL=1